MATPFIGEIRMFAGTFAPRSHAFCNGQLISIAQNTALFSILGTTYGGNGTVTFALPDLRGRLPIGFGQGPGLSAFQLGQTGGSATVVLTAAQMPSHTHTVQTSAAASSNSPVNNFFARTAGRTPPPFYNNDTAPAVAMNAGAVLPSTGSAQPHENMQPYLAINFIIGTSGIFPSRN